MAMFYHVRLRSRMYALEPYGEFELRRDANFAEFGANMANRMLKDSIRDILAIGRQGPNSEFGVHQYDIRVPTTRVSEGLVKRLKCKNSKT
jgi:hypothetical protein